MDINQSRNITVLKSVETEFMIYKRRWLVLIAFCSFSCSNAFAFVQYSPILSYSAKYYNRSEEDIIWFSNCYYMTYFFLAPLGILPLEKRLDFAIMGGSLITVIGEWMKYFAFQNYYYALISYIILGIGQIFILAAPAYISDKWFPQHERTIATSIGTFMNYFGLNFAIMFAAVYFNDIESDQIVERINFMNIIFALINTCAFVLCLLFVRNEPPTPPSLSAQTEKFSITKSYRGLIKSWRPIIDIFSIAAIIGCSWAYNVVISLLLEPYHYTQKQIALVSICYSCTGTVGGIIASLYVDHQIKLNIKPNYDRFIKGFITLGFIGMIVKLLIIKNVSDQVIIILSGVIGLGLNAFVPICIQSFIEKQFPSFELAIVTAMMQMSNLAGFGISYILILPQFGSSQLLVMIVLISPFYAYMLFIYHTKYHSSMSQYQTFRINDQFIQYLIKQLISTRSKQFIQANTFHY
ncbi:hypothetical protein pb186bvf_004487 [Paramecium bursaria]